MSTIKVLNLSPVGSNLFQDSESFLQELCDREINLIQGGALVTQVTVSAGYEIITSGDLALLSDEILLDGIGATEPSLL